MSNENVTEQDLLDLLKEIEAAKTEVAELTGKEKQLMKTLKDEWNCSSVKEAETKLSDLETKTEKLSATIKKGVEEIRTKYFEE